jgi:cell division protein FtsB
MKLNLDLKQVIGIFVIAATLGGFYYTTQMRLDRIEAAIEQKQPDGELQALKKQVQQLRKRVKKLERQ